MEKKREEGKRRFEKLALLKTSFGVKTILALSSSIRSKLKNMPPTAAFKPVKPTLFSVGLSNKAAQVRGGRGARSAPLAATIGERGHSKRGPTKPLKNSTSSNPPPHPQPPTHTLAPLQVRYIIYSKNLESKINIVSPGDLGGERRKYDPGPAAFLSPFTFLPTSTAAIPLFQQQRQHQA